MVWNPSEGIDLGFFMIRYYSLMFVIAFGLGWYLMKKIFERENEPIEKLDSIFIWTVLATLLGARLGQVFFYDWEYFRNNPAEILLPFKFEPEFHFTGFQGLASHGAAIVIVIAMYFFSKNIMKKPLLWVLDRVSITVASGAVFVRIGNFFNSEIYGHVTSSKLFSAVKFVKDDDFWKANSLKEITNAATENEGYNLIQNDSRFIETLNQIPFRHPAQLYEAFGYIFVFAILYFLYWKTEARNKPGFLLGVFLVLLWSIRFVVENVKESQGGFEEYPMFNALTTGQWLSIPFIIIGFFLIFRAQKSVQEA